MFWTSNYASSPHIEALLNKEDVTLYEIMDDEDILQECRSQNKKLVDYLTRSDVMEELITLTTKEPSMDIDERSRYKYPNLACELLTCDVPIMNEKLAGDQGLLAKLYSFIDTDQPLNPLLASFFSKTIGVLITRKSDQVLEFLKSRQTCVDLLLQHLETSAIMDLVLKLVTQVEGNDTRQNILSWLDSQELVQRLVKLLSPSSETGKHANAAQLLCDMITVVRENQRTSTERTEPDPILNTLESADTVSLLLETILTGEKLESSIVGGIQVLLALLGQKPNSVANEGDILGNGAVEEVMNNEQRVKISDATIPYLEQLHKLLLEPPYKAPVRTTAGVLECPLGNTRLHVAKLIAALLSTENPKVYEVLVDLETFQTLLDLFFKYTWNNFLHTQVQQCLALAVSCDHKDTNDIIYANLFIKCKLIERILEAWDKNDSKQNKEHGVRQGYMGHLINIANNIVSQCKKSEALNKFLKANLSSETLNKWDTLVETQLSAINRVHNVGLNVGNQEFMTNSEGNPNEYHSYSEEACLQQLYSGYHGQQVTSQFITSFGYYDDQFNVGDDVHSSNSVDQLTTLAFNLSEEDLDKREDMFNKMCQEKQKSGLEDCGGGVEWGDEGELTFQTVVEKRDWSSKQQQNDSNSSDEEEEEPAETNTNVNFGDKALWVHLTYWDSNKFTPPTNNVLPEVNPWDVTPSQPTESATGWANFDNFETSLSIDSTVIENKSEENEKEAQSNESTTTQISTVESTETTTSPVPVTTTVTTTENTVTPVNTVIDTSRNEQIVPENEISTESTGGGDNVAKSGDAVSITSNSNCDSNLDNEKLQNIVGSLGTVPTDTNANPSHEAGDRILDARSTQPVESSESNEDPLSEDKEKSLCISAKNEPPEPALPAKNAK